MILYIYLQEFGEMILKTLNIRCFKDIISKGHYTMYLSLIVERPNFLR